MPVEPFCRLLDLIVFDQDKKEDLNAGVEIFTRQVFIMNELKVVLG